MDTFEMAPRLHFSVAEFRFALGGDSFFGVADFFLTLLLVQSDLILGTLASFGSKYSAGRFFAWLGPKMHNWFCLCFGFIFGLDISLWTSCCLWSSWSSLSKTQVCMLRAKQSMETIPWSGPGQSRRESPSAFPATGAERALPWAPCPASGWLLLSPFKVFSMLFSPPPSCWWCSCTRCPRPRRWKCRWSRRCGQAASGRLGAWRGGPKNKKDSNHSTATVCSNGNMLHAFIFFFVSAQPSVYTW